MNTSARQTRGAENRKPTQKYALFQNKSTKKTMEEEKLENPQENDQYILKIVKQSISDKSKKRDTKVIEPTNNSTPEKNSNTEDEQIEIDDLQDILDDPAATIRYNKSKERGITLALQIQKSSVKPLVVQPTLMPKRIMSSKKTQSKNKKTLNINSNSEELLKLTPRKSSEKKVVVNKKKDRSALVGLKRTRKSRDQIY